MNATIENLHQAQERLETDYRQRMAALQQAQAQAQQAIEANATLEIAQAEQQAARQAQAQAIDSLNLTMTPVLDELKAINTDIAKMRSEIAKSHQRLQQMVQLQQGLYGRLGAVAREIGVAAAANRGAFDSQQDMQEWIASKIRHLIPLGATAVPDTDLPHKFRQPGLYGFRGYGVREQDTMILEALRYAR